MADPHVSAPANAPAKPHNITSWPENNIQRQSVRPIHLKHIWARQTQFRINKQTHVDSHHPRTSEEEVFNWSLWSDGRVQFYSKARNAMIYTVHLSFRCADIVLIRDGGPCIHVYNLQK